MNLLLINKKMKPNFKIKTKLNINFKFFIKKQIINTQIFFLFKI